VKEADNASDGVSSAAPGHLAVEFRLSNDGRPYLRLHSGKKAPRPRAGILPSADRQIAPRTAVWNGGAGEKLKR